MKNRKLLTISLFVGLFASLGCSLKASCGLKETGSWKLKQRSASLGHWMKKLLRQKFGMYRHAGELGNGKVVVIMNEGAYKIFGSKKGGYPQLTKGHEDVQEIVVNGNAFAIKALTDKGKTIYEKYDLGSAAPEKIEKTDFLQMQKSNFSTMKFVEN